MADDRHISGMKVGPFISARVTDVPPRTRTDRLWSLAAWVLTIALVAPAAPLLAVVLILGTAVVAAAWTAPDPDRKETRHER